MSLHGLLASLGLAVFMFSCIGMNLHAPSTAARLTQPSVCGNAQLLCFYFVLTTFTTVGYGNFFP